jgi:hypothetical protein
MRYRSCAFSFALPCALSLAVLTIAAISPGAAQPAGHPTVARTPPKTPAIINPPPTAQDWADIGKLPDWSGVWNPKITDQDAQVKTNPPPWNETAKKKIDHMFAEEKAGRPPLVFFGCFPEAHPTWMLVTHNAMEILFTPGRVTMLGESDGNRCAASTPTAAAPRRPRPTFHGHSIGHWEGDTLVVDTIGILPQAPLAISEAAGVPNNGDMRVVERIHLARRTSCMSIWRSSRRKS